MKVGDMVRLWTWKEGVWYKVVDLRKGEKEGKWDLMIRSEKGAIFPLLEMDLECWVVKMEERVLENGDVEVTLSREEMADQAVGEVVEEEEEDIMNITRRMLG